MENNSCSCKDDAVKTVFACSVAADIGEISDLHAGKLDRLLKPKIDTLIKYQI